MRKLGLIAAAIALFTAAMLYLVNRFTDLGPAGRAGGSADARGGTSANADVPPSPPPQEAPPPSYVDADPTEAIVIPAPPMPPTGPIKNEPARIQGPPPMPLPADPGERQEALQEVRKGRFADQMERLNRRNLERARLAPPPPPPSPAGTPPPPRPRQRPEPESEPQP